ncbi:Acetolactate synthase large subunit [Fervidicola ferrireducens]|uniref:Acetolactate synthase n=2 Tax=Fervidicola ferrireducens TaxID=520764 RepID=A0A140L8W2_9FIRM|nr:Acetolactate synthase large subunit [Fervidicola ferrireducens]
MRITAAEALVRSLEEEKVEVVFGYPGGAVLEIYDALFFNKKIKHVLTRSEQAAAHAASGYARVSGKVGVCIATSGPGATNLVTGIATAYMDSIPIVAITGQVPLSQIGGDMFQEVDITGATAPFTKHNYLVKNAGDIPRIVKEAFHIASTGRPGPVLIDLPRDVAREKIDFTYPEEVSLKGYKPTLQGHPLQIVKAVEAINSAKRPVILAGGGVISSGAHDELMRLAETADIPVTVSLMGIGSFPSEHPLFLGMAGTHGMPWANEALKKADLIIALGCRFNDRLTGGAGGFNKNTKIIHVDVDPAEIGKNVKVDIPIVGDIKNVLCELLKRIEKRSRKDWKDYLEGLKGEDVVEGCGDISPLDIIGELYKQTRGELIVTTDVGAHQMWTARCYKFKHPRSFITSGGLGTMGYGLPAAIGAKIANPNKQVIHITGDGSFQMNFAELATLRENDLSVKIILFNNRGLGLVKELQDIHCGGRYSQVHFGFLPDFVKLSESYGIKALRVESKKELEEAISTMLEEEGSFLLECILTMDVRVKSMLGKEEAYESHAGSLG